MKELFNNILVPVNLNRKRSFLYIEKAFHIARQLQCDLHIIHIEKGGQLSVKEYFSGISQEEKSTNTWHQLYQLQERYQQLSGDNNSNIHIDYYQGKAEPFILEYCVRNQIDIIITARPAMLYGFTEKLSIKRLARKTGCPVLSLDRKPGMEPLKNIVIPVDEKLSIRKLMFTSQLAKKLHSKIHLIALTENKVKQGTEDTGYLYRAYQLLRTHTSVVVECHPVTGDNIAETTRDFARRIQADLIVVDSDKESAQPGWLNSLFTRFVSNQSRIPVMTIASAI
jgi:nucleotide-binding universal stress UspA family protein